MKKTPGYHKIIPSALPLIKLLPTIMINRWIESTFRYVITAKKLRIYMIFLQGWYG